MSYRSSARPSGLGSSSRASSSLGSSSYSRGPNYAGASARTSDYRSDIAGRASSTLGSERRTAGTSSSRYSDYSRTSADKYGSASLSTPDYGATERRSSRESADKYSSLSNEVKDDYTSGISGEVSTDRRYREGSKDYKEASSAYRSGRRSSTTAESTSHRKSGRRDMDYVVSSRRSRDTSVDVRTGRDSTTDFLSTRDLDYTRNWTRDTPVNYPSSERKRHERSSSRAHDYLGTDLTRDSTSRSGRDSATDFLRATDLTSNRGTSDVSKDQGPSKDAKKKSMFSDLTDALAKHEQSLGQNAVKLKTKSKDLISKRKNRESAKQLMIAAEERKRSKTRQASSEAKDSGSDYLKKRTEQLLAEVQASREPKKDRKSMFAGLTDALVKTEKSLGQDIESLKSKSKDLTDKRNSRTSKELSESRKMPKDLYNDRKSGAREVRESQSGRDTPTDCSKIRSRGLSVDARSAAESSSDYFKIRSRDASIDRRTSRDVSVDLLNSGRTSRNYGSDFSALEKSFTGKSGRSSSVSEKGIADIIRSAGIPQSVFDQDDESGYSYYEDEDEWESDDEVAEQKPDNQDHQRQTDDEVKRRKEDEESMKQRKEDEKKQRNEQMEAEEKKRKEEREIREDEKRKKQEYEKKLEEEHKKAQEKRVAEILKSGGIPKSIFDRSDDEYSYYEDEDEYEDEDDYKLQKQLAGQTKQREEKQTTKEETKNEQKKEENIKGVVEHKSNDGNDPNDKQREKEESKLEKQRVSELLMSGVLKSAFDRNDDSEYEDDQSWDSEPDAELTIGLGKRDYENNTQTDTVADERRTKLKKEKGMQNEPTTVHEIKGENEMDQAVFKLPGRKAIGEADDEDDASLTKKQSDKTREKPDSKAVKSNKDSLTVKPPGTKHVDDDEEEDGDYGHVERKKSGSKIKGINAETNKRKRMVEIKSKLTDKGKIIDPLHQEYGAKHDPGGKDTIYFLKPSKNCDDDSDEELEAEVMDFGELVEPMHEIKIVSKYEKEAENENKKSENPSEDQKSVHLESTESDKSDSAKSKGPKLTDVKGNVKLIQKPKQILSDPTMETEEEAYEPYESYYPDIIKLRPDKTKTGRNKTSKNSAPSTRVPLGVLKPGDVEVESDDDDMEQNFTFDFPKKPNAQTASSKKIVKADTHRTESSSSHDEEKRHKSLHAKSGETPKTTKDSGLKSKSEKDSKHPTVKEKSKLLKLDDPTKTHSTDPRTEKMKTPGKSPSSFPGEPNADKGKSGDLLSRKEGTPKSSSQNIPKLTGAIKMNQKPAHRLTDRHEKIESGDYEPDEAYHPEKVRPRQERRPNKLGEPKVDKFGIPVKGVYDKSGTDTRPGVFRPGFIDFNDGDNENDFTFDPQYKIQKSSKISEPLKRTGEEELEPEKVGSAPSHKHDIRIKPSESRLRGKTDEKKPTPLKPGDVAASDDNPEADYFGPPKKGKQPAKKDNHDRPLKYAKSRPKTDSESKDKAKATPKASVDYGDTSDTDYTSSSPLKVDKKAPSSRKNDEELEPEEKRAHPTPKHEGKIKPKNDDKKKKSEPSTKNIPETKRPGSLKSGHIGIDDEADDFNVALPSNKKTPSKSAQDLSTKPKPEHETADAKDPKIREETATYSRLKKEKGIDEELEPEENGTPKGKAHGVKLKARSDKTPDKIKEQSATKNPVMTPTKITQDHDEEPDIDYIFGLPSKDAKKSHPKIDNPKGKTPASQSAKNTNLPKILKRDDVDYDCPDADYKLSPIKKGEEKPSLKIAKQSEDEELEPDEIQSPQPPRHDLKLKPKDKPTNKSDTSKARPSEKMLRNKEKSGEFKPEATHDGPDTNFKFGMPSTKDQAKKLLSDSSDRPRLESGKPEEEKTKPSSRRPIPDGEEIEPDELDIPKPNENDVKLKTKNDKEPSKPKPLTIPSDKVKEKPRTLKPGNVNEDDSPDADFTFGPLKNKAPKPSKNPAPTKKDEELEPNEIGKPTKSKHDVKLKPKGDKSTDKSDRSKSTHSEPKKSEERTKNPAFPKPESPDTDYTFGLPSKKTPKIPSRKEKPQNIEDEEFEPDEIGGPIKPKKDFKLKPKTDKIDDKKTPSKVLPESKKPGDEDKDAKKPGDNKHAKLKKAAGVVKKPTEKSAVKPTGLKPGDVENDDSPDADYTFRSPVKPRSVPIKPMNKNQPKSDEELDPDEVGGSSKPNHDVILKAKESPSASDAIPKNPTESKPEGTGKEPAKLTPKYDDAPDTDYIGRLPKTTDKKKPHDKKQGDEEYETEELVRETERKQRKSKEKPTGLKPTWTSDDNTPDADFALGAPRKSSDPKKQEPKEFDPELISSPERPKHDIKIKPNPTDVKDPVSSAPGTLIPGDIDADDVELVTAGQPKAKPEKKAESSKDKPAVASKPKGEKKETPKDKPKNPKDGTTSSNPTKPKEYLKAEDNPKERSRSPSKPKEVKPETGDASLPFQDSLKSVENRKERSKSPSAKPHERPKLSKPKSDEKVSSDKPEPAKKVSLKPVDKSKGKPESSSPKPKDLKDALKPVSKDCISTSKPSANNPKVAAKPKDSLKPSEKLKDRSKSPSGTKEKPTEDHKNDVPKLALSRPPTKPEADGTKAKPEENSKEKKITSNKSNDEGKPKDLLKPTENRRDRSKSPAKKPEEKPKVVDKSAEKPKDSLKHGDTLKERSKSPGKKPEDKVKPAKDKTTPKGSLKPADKPKERSKSPSARPEDKAKVSLTPKEEGKDPADKPKSSSSKPKLEKPKDSLKPDETPRDRSKSQSKKPDGNPRPSSTKPTDEKPKNISRKSKEEKPNDSFKPQKKPKERSRSPSKKTDDKAPKDKSKDSLKPEGKPRDRSKSPSKKPEDKPKSRSSKSKEGDKPKESLKPGDKSKERSPAKKSEETPKSTSVNLKESEKPKDSLKPREKLEERSKSPSKKLTDKENPSKHDDKPKESVKPKDKTKEVPSRKTQKDGDEGKTEPEDKPKTIKAPKKESDDEKKKPRKKPNEPNAGEEEDESESVKTKKSHKKPKKKDPDAENNDTEEGSGEGCEPDDNPKRKRRRRKPKDDENDDDDKAEKGRRGRSRSKKPSQRPNKPKPEEEPSKPKWVPPPRPPPDVYEMPPQEKPLVERLREEKIDPRKFYSKKTHEETNIPFVIPWEQAPALITQEGMGAFGAQRSAKAHVNDGRLKLTQGELKSENTLTLFEEGAKSVASQKGERSFGAHRMNVDKVVDSHKYESDLKLKLCETVIPQVNRGLLTSQTGMEFGNLRHQTTKVKYAKGMTPGFDKEGNKFLSRQFKPNSTEVAGSNLIDTRRATVQNVNGVELRMCPESDGIIPKLFSTQDIELKSGADFGSFRPLHTESEGGYRMTYDEEVKCKMAIPFQTAPSLLYFTNQ